MAAGRVDVTKKRGFDGWIRKGNGVVDFEARVVPENAIEDGEIVPSCEDGGCTALTKKRKCLPVVNAIDLELDSSDGVDDEEFCQWGDEGELVGARNLALSRWASDSDDELFPEPMAPSRKSSPESGEILGDVSDWDKSRSSLSYDRGSSVESARRGEDNGIEYESGSLVDVDGKWCKSSGVSQVDSFDENGEIEEEAVGASPGRVNMLQGCRRLDEYEYLIGINEGVYGKVFKARDKKTGEVVALKKVKMNAISARVLEEYGFPTSSLREISILMAFQHPSIVNVKEVVMSDHDEVFVAMEYIEHDLKSVMERMKYPFSTSEVKCLMLQLLEGVKYLHDIWVLHRDLKTSNILLNNKGELKICDFGMSRQYGSPLKPYTSLVVTLWYRAPELLLGAKQYSTAVDMWSVGCIMAELLAKEPLFRGAKEIDQLDKIFKVLGSPTDKIWPGFSKLPGAKANFAKQPYNLLRKKLPAASFTGRAVLSYLGLDLLNKLLTYDPEKRITVDEALDHPWFSEIPLPKSKEFMPTFPPQHVSYR